MYLELTSHQCRNAGAVATAMSGVRIVYQQQGFLIPLALFIILALAGLGITIAQLMSHGSASTLQEAIGIQALNAAESGAQYAMNQLLFDVGSQTQSDTNCTNVNGASLSFTSAGLNNCSSSISCTPGVNAGGTARIYDLVSTATCGGGEFESERTVAVRAIYE